MTSALASNPTPGSGFLRWKERALNWNYQNAAFPAALYLSLKQALASLISGNPRGFWDLHKGGENIGDGINAAFLQSVRSELNRAGNAASWDEQAIQAAFLTPEIKTVRFEHGQPVIGPAPVVHKPWGMEVWAAENPLFGVKFLYIMEGEHESLQFHERKHESQLYFQSVDVVHLNFDEYEKRKTAAKSFDGSPAAGDEVVASLPFVHVPGRHLAFRSISPRIVHTSRPLDGIAMNLEISGGAAFNDPGGTTRLLDRYSEADRATAARVQKNWWGARLPVSEALLPSRLAFDGAGSAPQETPLALSDGAVVLESNSFYSVEFLSLKPGEKRQRHVSGAAGDVLVVLRGSLRVETNQGAGVISAGHVYEAQAQETVTLNATAENAVVRVSAP